MKIEFTFEERDWPLDVDESVLALPIDERDEALTNQIRQSREYESFRGQGLGAPLKSAMTDAVRPLSRVPEIYQQEVEAGQELMSRGAEQFSEGDVFSGAGTFALGGLQYLGAPVDALFRGISGEPLGDVSERAALGLGAEQGTAESIGNFVEDFATIAPQVFTPGSVLKAAELATQPVLRLDQAKNIGQAQLGATGRQFEGAAGYLTGGRNQTPMEFVSDAKKLEDRQAAVAASNPLVREAEPVARRDTTRPIETDTTTKGSVERMSLATVNELVTDPGLIQRIQTAKNNYPDDPQRIFREVGDALRDDFLNGDLPIESLPRIMKDLGYKKDSDVIKLFETTASESGKNLNQLSQLAKQLGKSKKLPREIRDQLILNAEQLGKGNTKNVSKFLNGLRAAENFRRAMLVSQLGTAVRNTMSSVGRLGLSTIDDVIQAGLGRRGEGTLRDAWDSVASDFNALPVVRGATGYKEIVNDILENNPVVKNKLYGRSIQEVRGAGSIAKLANTFNILQEKFFRNMAFQSRLEKDLKSYGVGMNDIVNGKIKTKDGLADIPAKLLDDAIEHALQMTFASNGGKLAKSVVDGFEKIPFLYQINPFPRFAFANVLPFLRDFSPYGFAKAFSPNTLAKLTKGDSEEFANSMSKAMLGTTMFGTAMEIRNSDMAGEKWYEVVVNGKTYDARPFAPFSFYLLAAESTNPDNNLKPLDYAEAAIGINRISGTGLALIDYLRSDGKTSGKQIAKYLGDYLSGLTVPIKQFKDFLPEEMGGDQMIRDVKTNDPFDAIVNPTIRNIPGLSKELPVARSSTQEGPLQQEEGFFGLSGGLSSQLFGVRGRTKEIVQKEVDRLDLDYGTFAPRTGVPEANRYVSGIVGDNSWIIAALIDGAYKDVPMGNLIKRFGRYKGFEEFGFDVNKPYSKLTKAQQKMALGDLFSMLKKDAMNKMKRDNPSLYKIYREQGIPQVESDVMTEAAKTIRSNI